MLRFVNIFLSKLRHFHAEIQNELLRTLFKIEKEKSICSLSVLCSSQLILNRSPQISGQNKSEARELEGLVKITYGIVASSLFKKAGNSN